MAEKTVATVLAKTDEMLRTTQLGLDNLLGKDPTKRASGIHNVAVFGRSITIVIQNLRSAVDRTPDFEAWYTPHVERMKSDPLFRYFVDLRNEILKQGAPGTTVSLNIEQFVGNPFSEIQKVAPPGAEMFVGDNLGGSGFIVQLPGGSSVKYYVALPDEWNFEFRLHLPDPPKMRDGRPMKDSSIENLCSLYVAALRKIVADAHNTFG